MERQENNLDILWDEVITTAIEGDPEEVLGALAKFFRADAANETHELVKHCLEGAAEYCDHAQMAYYASTK